MQDLAQSTTSGRAFADSGELGFKLLQPLGLALVSLMVVWWLLFYGKDSGLDALSCAIYTNDNCEALATPARFAGPWAYRPWVLWIGLLVLIAGFVLSAQARRADIVNKVALAWTFVGIPLTWGVVQTLITAMKLFQ